MAKFLSAPPSSEYEDFDGVTAESVRPETAQDRASTTKWKISHVRALRNTDSTEVCPDCPSFRQTAA